MGEILLCSTSKALTEMPHSDPDNRMANDHFQITLTRKLRMPLWPTHDSITCACSQQIDAFGDHAFCCKKIVKNSMSNEIRDGFIRIFKRLFPSVAVVVMPSNHISELYPLPEMRLA